MRASDGLLAGASMQAYSPAICILGWGMTRYYTLRVHASTPGMIHPGGLPAQLPRGPIDLPGPLPHDPAGERVALPAHGGPL